MNITKKDEWFGVRTRIEGSYWVREPEKYLPKNILEGAGRYSSRLEIVQLVGGSQFG